MATFFRVVCVSFEFLLFSLLWVWDYPKGMACVLILNLASNARAEHLKKMAEEKGTWQ